MPELDLTQPFGQSTTYGLQSHFDQLGSQSIMENAQALPLANDFSLAPRQSIYGHETVGNLNPTLLNTSQSLGSVPDGGSSIGVPFFDKNLLTPSVDQGEK